MLLSDAETRTPPPAPRREARQPGSPAIVAVRPARTMKQCAVDRLRRGVRFRGMPTQEEKVERFLALHGGPLPLLMPNAWDQGSARILASLGFGALATTSGGFAATLGRLDGHVTREEALDHAAALVGATDLPVSADLENGFGDDPADVAETVELARQAGLAGCSIEDFTGDVDTPIYDAAFAAERVAAAAEAAHRGPTPLVLTARAENHIHHRDDLDDTIDRLQRYQVAGADVLFAPGVFTADAVGRIVAAVDRPVSVLALAGTPPVQELGALGVRRVSVGSSFAFAAFAALVDAATELRDQGTYQYWERARGSAAVARAAFRT
jgi:2-methylisocitrate lyase-like PEP mutase family enzyme